MASGSERKRVARQYRREEDDEQPIKTVVNAWIAAAAAAARQRSSARPSGAASASSSAPTPSEPEPAWSLVLETRYLLTLRALQSVDSGVCEATTVVPNPDAEELAAIAVAAPDLCALPLTSHALFAALADPQSPEWLQLAERGWRGSFGVVWLDYCGTFGSAARAGRQRQQDLEALFEQRLLARSPGAVLAVTFTTRGATELYRGELTESMALLAEGYALRHEQSVQLLGVASYHAQTGQRKPTGSPTMHTALFQTALSGQGDGLQVAPPAAAEGLLYVSGEMLRARIRQRGQGADQVAAATPLWSAVEWTGLAFAAAASVEQPEPEPEATAVVVIESTPLLPISSVAAGAAPGLTILPVLAGGEGNTAEMAIAAARVGYEKTFEDFFETPQSSEPAAGNGRQLEQPRPTVASALDGRPGRIAGAWLGYEALGGAAQGKPWRPSQLQKGEGPQPLWSDLHLLLSSESVCAQRSSNRCSNRSLAIGFGLRYSSTGEAWQGQVVDSLLHGVSVAAAQDGWQVASVGWVATYAVTTPRMACLIYLTPVSLETGVGLEWTIRTIVTDPSQTLTCGVDELERCCEIDRACFGDQEDQCTPIDELRQMHQPKDHQFIEVCCRCSEIVGFAAYTCWGDHAHIDIVAVAGEARRSGVATRLVHAALSRARQELKWECRLEVKEDNTAGRHLYERLGFTVRKREEGYYEDGSTALKLSCRLLPADLSRARTALWWYTQSAFSELEAAGADREAALVEAAKRWRKLQKRDLEAAGKWYGKEDEDKDRFTAEATVAAETLRIAQAALKEGQVSGPKHRIVLVLCCDLCSDRLLVIAAVKPAGGRAGASLQRLCATTGQAVADGLWLGHDPKEDPNGRC